jgi:hypothetical protein
MQHLTEEELVSHYYHDDEAPVVDSHLRDCAVCSAQYDTIRRVLTLVNEAPVPDRGDDYGDQVWNRLRWKLGSQRRRRATWFSGVAAAAALAVAFFAGHWWRAAHQPPAIAVATPPGAAAPHQAALPNQGEKILLLVVSDHLDDTERVLLELTNADPKKGMDVEQESRRAGELVAANRIYRQTASQHGNERIASILGDLEPVLIELSHAGNTLSSSKLIELQKRIEAKGLLFKVRVISAQTTKPRNENVHETNHI